MRLLKFMEMMPPLRRQGRANRHEPRGNTAASPAQETPVPPGAGRAPKRQKRTRRSLNARIDSFQSLGQKLGSARRN